MNQLQIPNVDEDTGRLTKDKHGVLPVNSISKQQYRAADAEIPECGWNNAASGLLAAKPLNDEPGHEQKLPREADRQPDLFARHESVPRPRSQEDGFEAAAMQLPPDRSAHSTLAATCRSVTFRKREGDG